VVSWPKARIGFARSKAAEDVLAEFERITSLVIMFDISGKSALITGGTSGIGAAIANQLLAAGCHVLVAGLPAEKPTPELDYRVEVAGLNVSDTESVRRLAASLERLDILVNSAGIIRRSAEFDLATFESVTQANLTGAMRMCMACRPLLAERGGLDR
jgi:2-dehydro-3-deoxy-D-gluconate 5-dehydrogenase